MYPPQSLPQLESGHDPSARRLMPPRRGFTTGDFDARFPGDDKFRALFFDLGDPAYYTATGFWWHLVAATWDQGRRVSLKRIVPTCPPEIAAALRTHGLVDHHGMVPISAFRRWLGPALQRRSLSAARTARFRDRQREGSATNADDAPKESPHGSDLNGRVTRDAASLARATGQEGSSSSSSSPGGGPGEGIAVPDLDRPPDALDIYWRLTGSFPTGGAQKWLTEIVNETADEEAVMRALGAEAGGGTGRGFLSRVQNRLRADKAHREQDAHRADVLREQDRIARSGTTPEQAAQSRALIAEYLGLAGDGPKPKEPN